MPSGPEPAAAHRFLLTLVTDRRRLGGPAASLAAATAARAGLDFIQVREKDLGDRPLRALAACLRGGGLAARATRVLVNGRPDIAVRGGRRRGPAARGRPPARDVRRAFPLPDHRGLLPFRGSGAAARRGRRGLRPSRPRLRDPGQGERALGLAVLAEPAAASGRPRPRHRRSPSRIAWPPCAPPERGAARPSGRSWKRRRMRSCGPSAPRREVSHFRRDAASDRRPRRHPRRPALRDRARAPGPCAPGAAPAGRAVRACALAATALVFLGAASRPRRDRPPVSPARAGAGGAGHLARLPVGVPPPPGSGAALAARQRRLGAASTAIGLGAIAQPLVRRRADAVPRHLRGGGRRGRPRPAGHARQPVRGDRPPHRSARQRGGLGARRGSRRARRAGLLAGHAAAHLGRRHPHRAQQRGRAARRPELQPSRGRRIRGW